MNTTDVIVISANKIRSVFENGPDGFREYLNTLDGTRRFDAGDPCECFMHNYFLDTLSINVDTYTDSVSMYDPNDLEYVDLVFEGGSDIPSWYSEFQDAVLDSEYQDEEDPYNTIRSVEQARRALEYVLLHQE